MDDILTGAILAKHAYENDLTHDTFKQDCKAHGIHVTPLQLLDERCWLLLDSQHSDRIYIAVRGTDSIHDLIMDCDVRKHYVAEFNGYVHRGFWNYYRESRNELMKVLRVLQPREIVIGGHSAGGSYGVFCALDLAVNKAVLRRDDVDITCISYGMPPAGDAQFVKTFNKHIDKSYRVVNTADLAPKIYLPGFAHVDREIPLKSDPKPNDKIPWDPIYHHSMTVYTDNLKALPLLPLLPLPSTASMSKPRRMMHTGIPTAPNTALLRRRACGGSRGSRIVPNHRLK